jgi:cyanamide hydratase
LLSFEFYGGLIALNLLDKEGAPKEQAESVAEAVIRHQDLGETGTLTAIAALIQLATIFGTLKFYFQKEGRGKGKGFG